MTPIHDDPLRLSHLSAQMADAVERAGRSIVHVSGRPGYGASGLVFAPELVLTADHVLERDDDLTVASGDAGPRPARLAGRDPATDLAVLRVPGLATNGALAGASAARVGQFALAVGRPGRHGLMASLGVVSAVGTPLRTARGTLLDAVIHTDATPYPGFSGGALIDVEGAVLGVLTSGLARGIGVAIPLATALAVAETLARDGAVARPYLGIGTQPVRVPEAQRAGGSPARGLLVVSIGDGSPAESAGILLGDLLVTVDGRPVDDVDVLQTLLAERSVGAACPVEVIRGGRRMALTVTLGPRPSAQR